MQHLGQAKSLEEKAQYLFKEILPKFNNKDLKTSMFDEVALMALLQTFYHILNEYDLGKLKDCNEYKLLRWSSGTVDLLSYRLKTFVEMINFEINQETLSGVDALCGVFYRKDHSKPLTDYEIEETAIYFRKQPFLYSLQALKCMSDLVNTLRDTYHTVYEDAEESSTEEGRRLVSMVNGLSGKDVTKWDAVYQLPIKTAFMYLEDAQIEYIKEKHKDSIQY